MNKLIGALFAFALVVLLVSTGTAASILQTLRIVDVKSNGTAVSYFSARPVRYWNFAGAGGNAAVSGDTMTIGTHYAPFNPDMGATDSRAAKIGSTVARPTCAVGVRGLIYTLQDAAGDGGTKDITYQCCKNGASYAWQTPACQ